MPNPDVDDVNAKTVTTTKRDNPDTKPAPVDEPVHAPDTDEPGTFTHENDGPVPPPDDPMDPPKPGTTDDAQKDNRDGN